LLLISNFLLLRPVAGGNYGGQYCSLLALIHTLYIIITKFITIASSC